MREALKLALEHIEGNYTVSDKDAITAIKEALAQPEQEPVAWWNGNSKFTTPKAKDWDKRTGGTTAFGCDIPLYTTPPQRKPLTGYINSAGINANDSPHIVVEKLERAIEAAHGIKE